MTRVDFYLLSEDDGTALGACRLAHKAFRLGHRIYILTPNEDEAATLDQLLWTFNAGAFIPHKINAGPLDPDIPVLLGASAPPDTFNDVLISLAPHVPEFAPRFARIAELVAASEPERAAARERFRVYRDRGFAVQTHNL